MKNIIPDATDAPPLTAKAFRVLRDRMYEAERSLEIRSSSGNATDKTLTATIQNLSVQVSDLQVRQLRGKNTPTINSGTLPADSTYHQYGPDFGVAVTITEPRYLLVTVGAGQCTIQTTGTAGVAVTANASVSVWSVSEGAYVEGGPLVSNFYWADTARLGGVPLITSGVFELIKPGEYWVLASMNAWANSASTGSTVQFVNPYVTALVGDKI